MKTLKAWMILFFTSIVMIFGGCIIDENGNEIKPNPLNPTDPTDPTDPHAELFGKIADQNGNPVVGANVGLFLQLPYSQTPIPRGDADVRSKDVPVPNSVDETGALKKTSCGVPNEIMYDSGLKKTKCIVEPAETFIAEAQTDESGSFNFKNIKTGTYVLRANKGMDTSLEWFEKLEGQEHLVVEMYLYQEPKLVDCRNEIFMKCDVGYIDACDLDMGAKGHECISDPNFRKCTWDSDCMADEYCGEMIIYDVASKKLPSTTSENVSVDAAQMIAENWGICLPRNEVDCDVGHNPVCGTDGLTYNNSCEAKNAGVQIEYNGVCQPQNTNSCPRLFAPVCGVDDMTYSNKCFADKAGTRIAYEGECDIYPPEPRCFTNNDCEAGTHCENIMTMNSHDLMVVDTLVVENVRRIPAPQGVCVTNLVCEELYAPVCGLNGTTYSTKCDAINAGVQIEHFGECKPQSGVLCPTIYEPVCGQDGITYSNKCEVEKSNVGVQHIGKCMMIIYD